MKKLLVNVDTLEAGVVNYIREGMGKLPSYLQPFLTWLTMKPLPGQEPLINRTNLSHLFTAYVWFISGLFITYYGQTTGWYIFMPLGFLFTVSGARKLSTVINHFCVHKDLLSPTVSKRHPQLHARIAEFNSSVLFLQGFKKYVEDHLTHHMVVIMASIADPDMAFLWQLGFRAGMNKTKLWLNFIFNVIFPLSPLHCLFIFSRIKAIIFQITVMRFIITLITIIAIVLVGYLTTFWTVFWVWIFPLFYLYHIAAIMQFSSEHFWLTEVAINGKISDSKTKTQLIHRSRRITTARFCGEEIPNTQNITVFLKYILWAKWWFKMLFVHLPTRLFVLPGDLCVHDFHHRSARGDNWANSAYARAAFIEALSKDQPPLMEVWGLFNVIDLVFDHLSKLPSIKPEVKIIESEMILDM